MYMYSSWKGLCISAVQKKWYWNNFCFLVINSEILDAFVQKQVALKQIVNSHILLTKQGTTLKTLTIFVSSLKETA